MPTPPVLVADIGGTNARFALAEPGVPDYDRAQVMSCREFASADAAIKHYLHSVQVTEISAMSIAVAGPVVNGSVRATNSHWHLSSQNLCESFNIPTANLINDFAAIAYSLPHLKTDNIKRIGNAAMPNLSADAFTVAIVGPGTGLGIGGLTKHGGKTTALVTEGGHVGFAPESATQASVRERLAHRYGRVSDERLISGPGIRNIYWALTELENTSTTHSEALGAGEIFARAARKSDPLAVAAVELFFEIFGQVAGNAALLQGAFDGVYLAGGVAQRYGDLLPLSRFREGFENKGRHRDLMQNIPAMLITHPNPGLLGAAAVIGQF